MNDLPKKPSPAPIHQYHVFLASPGDVAEERRQVREFFDRYNRSTAQLWQARFEVVDWENYATIGVGRPQELIIRQTIERFKHLLVLVVGIMGQRFGSPTGKAESGTEEEFNAAMEAHRALGFPEIKWFFRRVKEFVAPADPDQAAAALEQWRKVLAFRDRLKSLDPAIFCAEYPDASGFRDVFEADLQRWLADPARPWVAERPQVAMVSPSPISPPDKYYRNLEQDFRRMDIAGIDNDRAFEIPLSEMYVRLRVMYDPEAEEREEKGEAPDDWGESGPIDVQTALVRYRKLVIVGDPGSGKSTFLKYIALMLARSVLSGNPALAIEKLCLAEPLPLPIFLSCWDLADFLKRQPAVRLDALVLFVAERLAAFEFPVPADDVEKLLESGTCCLLFDGLDEVPTDQGRAAVSRMLEDCVARFPANRYVVTSRVRAYTGDTILKAEFTRCDVQPFNAADRAEFIRNWVALLFRVPRESVATGGGEPQREFQGLCRGIEESERIRVLAVNPLLLTVIAIVHWNRKRLPEQRVDLYDECVDVLLGQRKEAEHVQLARKVESLDLQREQDQYEERSWVRKRFAEIAIHIQGLEGDRDEATRADLVKLLTPRFIDRGATSDEQAASRAELFLERQELQSGLLVSRRAQTYRFVHLTFQEYLAAWHLSNQEFDAVTQFIQPHLRRPKWFETLQLLGGEWAKQSDAKLDRFLGWLLKNQGKKVGDRAPVVAVCSNLLRDTSGVAGLRPRTRRLFRSALEATLDAFRDRSGVPVATQLEILNALGQLGAAVKCHLIDATKAGPFPVRRRAVEMLLPHLSEDELFGMHHVLEDRSKKPVKTYLQSLLDCDPVRAEACILALTRLGDRLIKAIIEIPSCPEAISARARQALAARAIDNPDWHARKEALALLTSNWPDDTTRQLLARRALEDSDESVSGEALALLVDTWPDESTRGLLVARAVEDPHEDVRLEALGLLASGWRDETTRGLLVARAVEDPHEDVRLEALRLLASGWRDESTRQLVAARAVQGSSGSVRWTVSSWLASNWPDKTTRELLVARAVEDSDQVVRGNILGLLAMEWPDDSTRELLAARALNDPHESVRRQALRILAGY